MKRTPYFSCSTCVEADSPGYCAPLRCYCGHPDCTAYASYIEPKSITIPLPPKADKRQAQSWAEREEPTWLDR